MMKLRKIKKQLKKDFRSPKFIAHANPKWAQLSHVLKNFRSIKRKKLAAMIKYILSHPHKTEYHWNKL